MEPVTHVLTGVCLARAGFNRKAAYATLTMAIAAELPDIDTVWSLRGPVEGFTHHRGITHTILGLPFEAALLVGAVYGAHRWHRARQAKLTNLNRAPKLPLKNLTPPPRWGWLYLCALIALLSHLLLDYTNNYGLRPFYPFNPRWYAGSIVFIFDPLIFLLLLGAIVLPALFAMVGAEVGARKQVFRGRGLALAALAGIVLLWSLRAVEHQKAISVAMAQSIVQPTRQMCCPESTAPPDDNTPAPPEPQPVYLTAQRALASPDPISPFQWTATTDFGPLYQLAEVDLWNGTATPDEQLLWKPDGSRETRLAQTSALGRAYMDWSPMPLIQVGDVQQVRGLGRVRIVTFADPRFMGGWMARAGRDALLGTVILNETGRVVRQTIGGRIDQEIDP